MKIDTALLIVALGLVVIIAAFSPAYATNLGGNFEGEGNTYNEGSSANMQNITVSVDSSQYSAAITNTVDYRSETVIDSSVQGGRTVQYVPKSTSTLTYNASVKNVCELGVLDLTVASSEVLSSYTMLIDPVSGTMTGTFYLRYWADPANNLNRENTAPTGVCVFDTTDGCTFTLNPAATHVVVSLCLEAVPAASITPALDDVSFSIVVVANDNGGGS